MSSVSTPLNIAHFRVTSGIRGLERNTIRMMNYERQRGHRAWIITTPTSPVVSLAREAGLEAVTARVAGDLNLLTPLRIAAILRREQADLLHLHGSHGAFLASMGGRMAGIPVLATLHSSYSRLAYDGAHHLMAVSHAVRDHMVAQGVHPTRITVVQNGIDLDTFSPRPQADALRELGLEADRIYFAVACLLSPGKGVLPLLDAFMRLHAVHPDTGLLIAGDGPVRSELAAAVRQHGAEDVVRLFGFLEDVRPVIAASDCLVMNSLEREGMPQAVLQAMAMARPVIATDIGGTVEAISRPELGLVLPAGDQDALVAALTRAHADAAWRATVGQAAHAHIAQEFSITRQIDGIEAVYRRFTRQG